MLDKRRRRGQTRPAAVDWATEGSAEDVKLMNSQSTSLYILGFDEKICWYIPLMYISCGYCWLHKGKSEAISSIVHLIIKYLNIMYYILGVYQEPMKTIQSKFLLHNQMVSNLELIYQASIDHQASQLWKYRILGETLSHQKSCNQSRIAISRLVCIHRRPKNV